MSETNYKNKPWGEWRDWTYDEWEGHDVFIVCDNMPLLDKMPMGFWKCLYGERVVGIGSVVKAIGDRPEHKGNFMRKAEAKEDTAVAIAKVHGAKRIILIHPTMDWKEQDGIIIVRDPVHLSNIAFDSHIKEFPQLFKDKTVFITSGGPTFPWRQFKDGLLDGQVVLGVNRIIALCSNFDAYFLGDSRGYWEHGHKKEIDGFGKPAFCANQKWPMDRSVIGVPAFQLVRVGLSEGLDPRPDRIAWNKSSGGAAIDVAVHMGARKIVLLGYDMRAVNGQMNWYGEAFKDRDNAGLTFMKAKKEMLASFLLPYPKIARDAQSRGIEIINATKDSAITSFPYVPLEKLI